MKRALVEAVINQNIVKLVAVLILLCVSGTIGYAVFTDAAHGVHPYGRCVMRTFISHMDRPLHICITHHA